MWFYGKFKFIKFEKKSNYFIRINFQFLIEKIPFSAPPQVHAPIDQRLPGRVLHQPGSAGTARFWLCTFYGDEPNEPVPVVSSALSGLKKYIKKLSKNRKK